MSVDMNANAACHNVKVSVLEEFALFRFFFFFFLLKQIVVLHYINQNWNA